MQMWEFSSRLLRHVFSVFFHPGDVEIGLLERNGGLEVEVVQARGLTMKAGSKTPPGLSQQTRNTVQSEQKCSGYQPSFCPGRIRWKRYPKGPKGGQLEFFHSIIQQYSRYWSHLHTRARAHTYIHTQTHRHTRTHTHSYWLQKQRQSREAWV